MDSAASIFILASLSIFIISLIISCKMNPSLQIKKYAYENNRINYITCVLYFNLFDYIDKIIEVLLEFITEKVFKCLKS